ncbi:odorant receptor 78 isoform X1 [Nasonia vitripennis]|uniref:Odorant receptor n=1 Tax=Nasonia vitripennis TaxID=7425 RepID=A0A7M7LQW6_NASVI|nr:odorant receptor 78 isoform X1 [Nasonia vitripennis]
MARSFASFDEYTFLNRWGLTFLGIWKSDAEARGGPLRRFLHRLHVTILFTLLMLLLLPQWMDMYVLWGNIDANAETFVLNVFTITALLKLWCFLSARQIFEVPENARAATEARVYFLKFEIKQVIDTMKENWRRTMSGDEPGRKTHREILLDMAGKARDYTKRYGLLMYSTATMYFVSPFVGMQRDNVRIRKYPFFGWYYFDRFSNLYYGICYASQVIIGIVVGTSNYAMDSIFLVAIYHTCARLQMLQHDLKKIGEDRENRSPEEIVQLIRLHQREIRDAKRLTKIFNGSSLQQLLVSCVIICIIGFKLIIALNDGGFEFLVYVAFMFVALLQIFLYCRPGDELIVQSTAVGYAAYQSHWTSLEAESIRKIMFMILRSQTSLKMTAGNFYVLSLPNFTMILRMSMSFLSLLRAMYRKSDGFG